MKLKEYFEEKLGQYKGQYSRMGVATLVNEDGDVILVDRNTEIDTLINDGYQLVIDEGKIPSSVIDSYDRGIVSVGLFEGRHSLPVKEYIYTGEYSPTDFQRMSIEAGRFFGLMRHNRDFAPHTINIYITGLTAGTIAALRAVIGVFPSADVICWHYDRETGEYIPQEWK